MFSKKKRFLLFYHYTSFPISESFIAQLLLYLRARQKRLFCALFGKILDFSVTNFLRMLTSTVSKLIQTCKLVNQIWNNIIYYNIMWKYKLQFVLQNVSIGIQKLLPIKHNFAKKTTPWICTCISDTFQKLSRSQLITLNNKKLELFKEINYIHEKRLFSRVGMS